MSNRVAAAIAPCLEEIRTSIQILFAVAETRCDASSFRHNCAPQDLDLGSRKRHPRLGITISTLNTTVAPKKEATPNMLIYPAGPKSTSGQWVG